MSILISSVSEGLKIDAAQDVGLPLDERLLQAWTETGVEQYANKISELDRIKDYRNAIAPEDLYAFQTRASEYSLLIGYLSASVRKGVSAIDTVIRA